MARGRQAVIHYARVGKPTVRYVEGLLDDDGRRVRTRSALTPGAFRPPWLEPEQEVGSVAKYLFYGENFAIMELRDPAHRLLGHYCDVVDRLERRDGEYFLRDMLLDLWLPHGGQPRELDWDEFRAASAAGLLTTDEQECAVSTLSRMTREVDVGTFPHRYVDSLERSRGRT